MARKSSIKYAMCKSLENQLHYGEKKHDDKELNKQERAELKKQGIAYKDRIKMVNHSKDKIYSSSTYKTYLAEVQKYGDYLAEKGLKKIDLKEAQKYVQEYIDYLDKERELSPYSVYKAASGIAKSLGTYLSDYNLPTRSIAHLKRGKAIAIHDEFNEKKYGKSLEINRLLGMRRAALTRLQAKDIYEREIDGMRCVIVEKQSKGGKTNRQYFYDEKEMEQVLALKQGKKPEDRILEPSEISHDANYHECREQRAKEVYYRCVQDMEKNPERRVWYQNEIRRIFAEAGRTVKENMDKPVFVRGENRDRLIAENREVEYDRTALLFVSVTVTNHWRSSVSLNFYIAR